MAEIATTGMSMFIIGSELKVKPLKMPLDHMFVSVASTFMSMLCSGVDICIESSTSTPVAWSQLAAIVAEKPLTGGAERL